MMAALLDSTSRSSEDSEKKDADGNDSTVSNSFDVAISNGAFCLIPSKKKAFEQVYQLLKPGGRMSICTTTVQKDLDVETQWPVCMRMFIHLDKLKPMCEEIGFQNVVVDLENADLEWEMDAS